MNLYIDLAQKAIKTYLKSDQTMDPPADLPKEFQQKSACFVSIHRATGQHGHMATSADELRGCIGTILPTKKTLAQEIIANAISAATRDPRFEPIKEDELPNLEIKVDVLHRPEPIEGLKSLDPKKYGVIVKTDDGRSGVLLPDLPGIDDPAYQIAIATQKGGIDPNENYFLFRFEVERHE